MSSVRFLSHPGTPSGHISGIIFNALSSLCGISSGGIDRQAWDSKARFVVDTPTCLEWTLEGDSTTWTSLKGKAAISTKQSQEGTVFLQQDGQATFGIRAVVKAIEMLLPAKEFAAAVEGASGANGNAWLPLNPDLAGHGVRIKLPTSQRAWESELAVPITGQVLQLSELAASAGFARTQSEYEEAQHKLLHSMEQLNSILGASRFLTSNFTVTLIDILLFSFLVRFEPVHHALHKCNMHLLEEGASTFTPGVRGQPGSYSPQWQSKWPHLLGFGRDIWSTVPGAAEASPIAEISKHHWLTFGELLSGREVEIRGLGPDWWFPPLARFERFLKHASDAGISAAAGAVAGVAGDDSGQPAPKGAFVRGKSGFRASIGDADFPAEPGRYHLFVANNCPWCHRATLARAVKGLRDVISVDVLAYRRDAEKGWQFDETYDPEVCTPLSQGKSGGVKYIPELYAAEGSTERSVPILYDTKTQRIVNNESAEIVRVLNSAFPEASLAGGAPDLYPVELRPLINQLNSWIYPHINNGAYRSGFASSQSAYDSAFPAFFSAMERLERLLATTSWPFLAGSRVTEADIRLLPTIYRFDSVYYTRFRLNKLSLASFPALKAWLQRMVSEVPGVAEASNLAHCKVGYYGRTGTGLVPAGPAEYHRLQALQGTQLGGQGTEIVGSLPLVQPADSSAAASTV